MLRWVEFLKEITKHTDKIAMRYFNAEKLQVTIKEDYTPVSQADHEIEDYIREQVVLKHPELSITGEEYGHTETDSNVRLIIDPIDGTKNFVAGIPFFATLLAIEEEGEVVAGLVSAPATKDLWWAEKGEGAFHNGQRIHVSTTDNIGASLAFHGSLYGPEASTIAEPVLALLSKTYRQRGFADYYQHMLVAMGKGEFSLDFNIKQWDIAPLKIIVEEAGGICTDSKGNISIHGGNAVCSNGLFHDSLISELNGVS